MLCFVLLGLFSLPLFECFPTLFFLLLLLLSVLLQVQCAWCLCAWSKILEAVPVSGYSRDGCCLQNVFIQCLPLKINFTMCLAKVYIHFIPRGHALVQTFDILLHLTVPYSFCKLIICPCTLFLYPRQNHPDTLRFSLSEPCCCCLLLALPRSMIKIDSVHSVWSTLKTRFHCNL